MIVRILNTLSYRRPEVARRCHELSLATWARDGLIAYVRTAGSASRRGAGGGASQDKGHGANRGLCHEHPGNLNLEPLTSPAVGPATVPSITSSNSDRGASTGGCQGSIPKERSQHGVHRQGMPLRQTDRHQDDRGPPGPDSQPSLEAREPASGPGPPDAWQQKSVSFM